MKNVEVVSPTKSLIESVVTAMDGSDGGLFPFFPYIFQDTWEIGAQPELIVELVKKNTKKHSRLKILDLGCGKGIVSIKLAREFQCTCFGIDAIGEFIDAATDKAREYHVDNLCKFEVGDIRDRIVLLARFDVIILGAVGSVFGDYRSTLAILSEHLTGVGIIVVDDGYIENDSDFNHPLMQRREVVEKQIKDAGMKIVDEVVSGKEELKDFDGRIFEKIKKRCNELAAKHPDKTSLFENYIKAQEKENEVLEEKVICSTIVLKRKTSHFKEVLEHLRTKTKLRLAVGSSFVILGLLIHLIPLVPGSWLIIIGLEILGIRLLLQNKFKERFGRKK